MIECSNSSFQLSTNAHNHPADPGAAVSVAMTATVKTKAAADIFRPASPIVEEVLLDQMTDGPCSSLPRPQYITQAANRKRQQLRPKDPLDLEFELEDARGGGGGGRGTPLYKVYRYVPPQRVWFLSRFGLKTGIDFDNYGLKSGRVFGAGNIYESLQTYFSSQYVTGTTN